MQQHGVVSGNRAAFEEDDVAPERQALAVILPQAERTCVLTSHLGACLSKIPAPAMLDGAAHRRPARELTAFEAERPFVSEIPLDFRRQKPRPPTTR